MIISDSRKEVFCHIPKNGGSSLRKYFMSIWEDAREYQGRKPVVASDNTVRDLTHITVYETQDWFNDRLLAEDYKIMAVIRCPKKRFSSALLQYVRSFRAEHKHFVQGDDITKLMENISIPSFCQKADKDISCIYFRPQTDFIKNIAPNYQDLILLEELSTRFPSLPRDNPGGSLPNWLKAIKHPVIRNLAGGLGDGVKRRIARRLIRIDPSVKIALNKIMDDNKAFIHDFYKDDQALYEKLLSKHQIDRQVNDEAS